jgi:hypothetical protein
LTIGVWAGKQREPARRGLAAIGTSSYIETSFSQATPQAAFTHFQLLDAAREAPIHTFGWPIGVFFDREEHRPRPRRDGITAEIAWPERNTYDYWALSLAGDFYLLKTLSEDALGHPEAIFFNTRIVRTTERLLYCQRLYRSLGVADDAMVQMEIRYVGFSGRILAAAGGRRVVFDNRVAVENETEHVEEFRLGDIETKLVSLVRAFCDPLFVLFDFFRLEDSVYEEIVAAFRTGKVA